ncbi:sigma-70 family RNA polymerase sigma factor [Lentilactobacillus hilgardii]|nr:sigma-70 family RNA polymerase sigma factor [Lentilactobacillus hilgardii]MCV3741780.1 sigma-70 family RNA polymerase sigma factor [Lentilactobacillus hilgardii]
MNYQEQRDRTEAFNFLLDGDHELIIYGVLKRLHVMKGNPLYDDMVQEGRLAFVNKYIQGINAEKKPNPFLAYIYQGVYWAMIDYMNKQRVSDGHIYEVTGDDNPLDEISDINQSVERMDGIALIETLSGLCTTNELKYLKCAYYLGMNVTEIAHYTGVSRVTVHKWRKNLIQKVGKLQ